MSLPTISVINFSSHLTDQKVQDATRAINRQMQEDFAPIWGLAWNLELHGASFAPSSPDSLTAEPVRGDAVIYLVDQATLPGALGYHDLNTNALPVGFVFVIDPQDWTVTFSHETLEMILDPTASVLVPGPDPRAGVKAKRSCSMPMRPATPSSE